MNQDSSNQTTLGHDVFVSYASHDVAVANAVVENIEQHGIKCWIAPRDVTPGSQYADEIVRAINDAQVFVLLLSEHALASAHVGRELERAASKRRRIIVLRTDAAPLTRSFEYFLSESQWIDVAALGVPAALTKLTQAVGQRLSPSSWVSPGLGADARNPADRKLKPSYLTIRRLIAAAVFLVVAAFVVGVMVRYWPSKQSGPQAPVVAAISDKSIAVLPFVDMSEKKDQEYFGDGMAEEIIDLLVKVPGLKVISRTSSFQFKGQAQDLRTVGALLGVGYMLEGSVRRSGDHLRVTAQLIDSTDGTHLMSRTYDRDIQDVLNLQEEIAASLVRALQITVGADKDALHPPLTNPQAYTLYLRGRHGYDRFDQQGFEEATSDFEQAVKLDPTLVSASLWLAVLYDGLGEWGYLPQAVAFEKARSAAQHTIDLDPKSAPAHAVLGSIHLVYDWDWAAADRELDQARTLSPHEAGVLFFCGRQAMASGRLDDALSILNESLTLDPLLPPAYIVINWIQLRRHHLAEAEAAARRALEISPSYASAHYRLGIVLLEEGNLEAALTEFSKENEIPRRLAGLAIINWALGHKAESDRSLSQMQAGHASGNAYDVATVYAYRGQSDLALRWLDRAYTQKDIDLYLIKGDPLLKNLEGDPHYNNFLRKLNVPQ